MPDPRPSPGVAGLVQTVVDAALKLALAVAALLAAWAVQSAPAPGPAAAAAAPASFGPAPAVRPCGCPIPAPTPDPRPTPGPKPTPGPDSSVVALGRQLARDAVAAEVEALRRTADSPNWSSSRGMESISRTRFAEAHKAAVAAVAADLGKRFGPPTFATLTPDQQAPLRQYLRDLADAVEAEGARADGR